MKSILLILSMSLVSLTPAFAVRIIHRNTEKMAFVLSNPTLMKQITKSLQKDFPDETMNLGAVTWMGTGGGTLVRKVDDYFKLTFTNVMYTSYMPSKKCEVLVTVTETIPEQKVSTSFRKQCQ